MHERHRNQQMRSIENEAYANRLHTDLEKFKHEEEDYFSK